MKAPFKLALTATLLSGIALATPASATDKELLNTLLENGVLTKAQHEKLMSQADEKEVKMTSKSSSILDMDWASRVKISGDMRVRYEDKQSDTKGVSESRQRIRARLAIAAKINDEVDAGFRLVTGGGITSTNQDLEGGFIGKSVFFDRAFIDWHPDFAPGAHLIAGKMKQPWYTLGKGLIWDTDVNPEGLALTYEKKFGDAKVKATAGYFIVEDGKNLVATSSANDGFSQDQKMFHGGISGEMKFTNAVKGSVGFNTYIYDDAIGNGVADGDLNTDAELYEISGKLDVKTGLMPVKLYAQYVVNAAASDGNQNVAWLAGVATKYKKFSLDYNYRDTQVDAVVSTFNDSDFAFGVTGARGHKLSLGYKISKNFSTAVTYYAAQAYGVNNTDGDNIDVLHVDLKAKF
ncbi:MAG: hypothetical protein GQ569_13280 [Methylococcaceae bacterium]|nr:hypothetical protein [Methylococcaceae bacterium]